MPKGRIEYMTHNPYSAPSAPSPIPKADRPLPVVFAIWIFIASCALGAFYAYQARNEFPDPVLTFVGMAIGGVIYAGLLFAAYHRKNWARWTIIVILAINVFILPRTIGHEIERRVMSMYLAQGIMQITVILLLLLPVSSRWYRSKHSEK